MDYRKKFAVDRAAKVTTTAIDLRTLDRHHDAAIGLIPPRCRVGHAAERAFAELVKLSPTGIADDLYSARVARLAGSPEPCDAI